MSTPDWPADLPEDKLNELVLDIFKGKVFLDVMIDDADNVIGAVFMPIAFGALAGKTEAELENVGWAYEYIDKAGPRAVNGYPTFMSVNFLNATQRLIAIEKLDKLYKATNEVMHVEQGS